MTDPVEPTSAIAAGAPARPCIYVACLASYNSGILPVDSYYHPG